MVVSGTTKRLPRLLRTKYLADQEFLLEETRASRLLYFPGPTAFSLLFGILGYLTWAPVLHAPGWSAFTSALDKFASYLPSVSVDSVRLSFATLFTLLFALGLLWLVVRWLRWIRTVYAVTSRRVIVQKGILGRYLEEIPVTQVRGVDVHQTFGQRLFGFGTVRVSSEQGATVGNEDWEGIPKPFRFQKHIENATEAVETPVRMAP